MKNLLLVFLIGSILLLGCTQDTNKTINVTKEDSMQKNDNNSITDDTKSENAKEENFENSDTSDNMEENQKEENTNSENDFFGKTFSQLSMLGVPLQCDIITKIDGESTKSKVYMKGDSEIRSEIVIDSNAGCENFIYIMKNNKAYMGCQEGEIFEGIAMFEGCNWIEFETNEGTVENDESSYSYSASTPDFDSVPESDISCMPWIYDSSKFDISGKVCNIEEMMKGTEFP